MPLRSTTGRIPTLSVMLTGVAAVLPALSGCGGGASRVNEDRILQRAGLTANERQPGRPADEPVENEPATLAARPVSAEPIADVQVLVGTPDRARAAGTNSQSGPARSADPAPDAQPLATPSPTTQPTPRGVGTARGAGASGTSAGAGGAGRAGGAWGSDSGFVDAVVGQINGRPVYASEFFAPMDARLRADAARLPQNQWMNQTAQAIRSALRERMVQELLLAEFQASLTREQRQGLLAFVGSLRQRMIAENLGSESLASNRLQETEGLTLDQKIQQQRDTEIIRAQIMRAIGDRIYVSWREIELEYERNYEEYNPLPIARLRMIQISERNQERIEQAREAIASGEPFETVATRFSDFRASEGGLWTITVDREGYENTRIFAPEELNSVAVRLSPGEVSDEFRWSGSVVWLKLDEIERPTARSLYDAQLEIHDRLRRLRIAEEESEYVIRLLGRSSITDMTEMLVQLVDIARQRYLQQPQPAPAPGS